MLSFTPMNGGGALANYITFFTDTSMWPTIIVTLKLAVPATVINVGVAVPVAFALRRKSPLSEVGDDAARDPDDARHRADRRRHADVLRPERLVSAVAAGPASL